MVNNFLYLVDNKEYEVVVTRKRIRNIHFRFDGEKFLISAPYLTSVNKIKSGLDKFAQKLIATNVKSQAESDSYIYVFGEKVELTESHEICIDETVIKYKDINALKRKLKAVFLDYVTQQTENYAKLMNAPLYTVKVRQMRSRYGSNNRNNKTITYSLTLLHYSKEIIDSVIIHELVHCFVFNHSDKFYKILYKYSPNYDKLRKKLLKAEFN